MKKNTYKILFTFIVITLVFNGCEKLEKEKFNCRVINASTGEPLKYFPVQFSELTSRLFGDSYTLLAIRNTDGNGYVNFSIDINKHNYGYAISNVEDVDQDKDTTQKFFDDRIPFDDDKENILALKPRGLICIGIDSTIPNYKFMNSFEVKTTEFNKQILTKTEIKKGFYIYVNPNQSHNFQFRLKGTFIDTTIFRKIYVRDCYISKSHSSLVPYTLKY